MVLMLMSCTAFVLAPAVAVADNGPHEGGGPTGDGCAACHRAHTAQQTQLLTASPDALCLSCHGSSGLGSSTNVVDGAYTGPGGGALLGGGFSNVYMDTDGNGGQSRATTSRHALGTVTTVWGSGPLVTSEFEGMGGVTLSCTDCHNPHGSAGSTGQATYRVLRSTPDVSGDVPMSAGAPADVSDQGTKEYTISSSTGMYRGQSYGALAPALSSWCSQCHQRYLATVNDRELASADPIYKFRHQSDGIGQNPSCLSCHVAHGTAADMSTLEYNPPPIDPAELYWPNAVTPGLVGLNYRNIREPSLLRMNDRLTCQQSGCH